jgi:hypothetical protein
MAGFTYKGVSLETILERGSTSLSNTFPGLNVNRTDYNGMKPLITGFTINGEDISNLYSATTSIYTAIPSPDSSVKRTNVLIPKDVKQIRIIALGGGGGGGGPGGDAEVDWRSDSTTGSAYAVGGHGGPGGYGKYLYMTDTITSNKNVVSIYIGAGGAAGNRGNKGYIKAGVSGGDSTEGSPGGYGGFGLSSGVQLLSYESNTGDLNEPTYTAQGGLGGIPGNGAKADMSRNKDRTVYSGNRNIPTSDVYGERNISYINIDNNYINTSYHGIGGNGGTTDRISNTANNANFNIANSGTNGYVQIIWLYG